jgi:hypothetical protein
VYFKDFKPVFQDEAHGAPVKRVGFKQNSFSGNRGDVLTYYEGTSDINWTGYFAESASAQVGNILHLGAEFKVGGAEREKHTAMPSGNDTLPAEAVATGGVSLYALRDGKLLLTAVDRGTNYQGCPMGTKRVYKEGTVTQEACDINRGWNSRWTRSEILNPDGTIARVGVIAGQCGDGTSGTAKLGSARWGSFDELDPESVKCTSDGMSMRTCTTSSAFAASTWWGGASRIQFTLSLKATGFKPFTLECQYSVSKFAFQIQLAPLQPGIPLSSP